MSKKPWVRWQDRQPRRLPDLNDEWTHWWLEGDGSLLEVVPGDDPVRAYRVVEENRERMNNIVAQRARRDPKSGEYVADPDRYVITAWDPRTRRS